MLKNIFSPGFYPRKIDAALLLLRLVSGLSMLSHGAGKLLQLFGDEPIEFADPLGIGETGSLALTVFAEVFCSLLLVLGFATRLALIPLIITMFVIIVLVQGVGGFGEIELALFYLAIYCTLAITGAGRFSIDHFIYDKIKLRS